MKNPNSHFAYTQANMNISRSLFPRNQEILTTFSAGHLYPFYVDEILPGDTFSIDTSCVMRMSTPIHPVMGDAFVDMFYFFIPNRLLWDHWEQFKGAVEEDPYINPIEYRVPALVSSQNPEESDRGAPIPHKSLLDYLTLPAGTQPKEISALFTRAYVKVWNEWFRDQNTMLAADFDTSDADMNYANAAYPEYWDNNNATNPNSYVRNAIHGGDLCPVSKYHDYFTSALPQPQRGVDVPIPLNGFAPVYANSLFDYSGIDVDSIEGLSDLRYMNTVSGGSVSGVTPTLDSTGNTIAGDSVNSHPGASGITPVNLAAYLGLAADRSAGEGYAYSTISDLRYAFQLQKLLEADNRFGSRYIEQLKAHFNVDAPQGLLQRSEFLGGKRLQLNMSQVVQTSSTDDISPQGNVAAYSLTADRSSSFTKSFVEDGILLGVLCLRVNHVYQQGIEPMFTRFDRFSYYYPEFSSISDQPIYNKEIFNGIASPDPELNNVDYELADKIFGYKAAWDEYRYKPNKVVAEFRSNYPQSLDIWHYGDYYLSQPYLSSEWMRESRSNIDRTLAVQDPDTDQVIADILIHNKSARPLPMFGIPGLADHH